MDTPSTGCMIMPFPLTFLCTEREMLTDSDLALFSSYSTLFTQEQYSEKVDHKFVSSQGRFV